MPTLPFGRLSLVMICTFVCCGYTGSAAETIAPQRDIGPSVKMGVVYAKENFDLTELERQIGVDIDPSSSLGVEISLGYRWSRYVATALSAQYYDAFDIRILGHKVAKADAWALSSDVIAYPCTGWLQPYALLGVGMLRAAVAGPGVSDGTTEFLLRGAIGIEIYPLATVAIDLGVGYALPAEGNVKSFPFIPITLGIKLRLD